LNPASRHVEEIIAFEVGRRERKRDDARRRSFDAEEEHAIALGTRIETNPSLERVPDRSGRRVFRRGAVYAVVESRFVEGDRGIGRDGDAEAVRIGGDSHLCVSIVRVVEDPIVFFHRVLWLGAAQHPEPDLGDSSRDGYGRKGNRIDDE
jgi:hypothetical protein